MADSSGMRAGLTGNVEEALRLFASEAEWAGLNLAETEFVLEETLKCYGATFDGEMIRELFKFYRRYLGMASVSRRQQLLTKITAFISDGHQHRHIALLCFISADKDGQITSGAALDLAMVMPCDPDDPLTGPKYVAQHGCGGLRAKFGGPKSDDEGDVAAGLLLLGDMRLLPLLEEIWERLTPEARRRMVQRRSNLVSALMIEFLLRHLEADKAEDYHGELGAALHNLPEIASRLPMAVVMDIRRNFGLPPGKEPMELLGRETLAEAFTRIRPRLQALIDRESEPKVLPNVLATWAAAAGAEMGNDPIEDSDEDEDGTSTMILDPALRDEYEEIANRFDEELGYECPKEVSVPLNPYEVWPKTYEEVAKVFAREKTFPVLLLGRCAGPRPELVIYLLTADERGSWDLYRYEMRPDGCFAGWMAIMAIEDTDMILDGLRHGGAVQRAYDYVTSLVMGKSRLTPPYTLYVSSEHISELDSSNGAFLVARSMCGGQAELEDLVRSKQEADPWARLTRKLSGRVTPPANDAERLSIADANELARLIHSRETQRSEMKNIARAWAAAAKGDKARDVITADQLLELLYHLAIDMPGLLRWEGDFVPERRPIVDRYDEPGLGVAPPKVVKMETPPPAQATPAPRLAPLTGLAWFLDALAPWEVILNIVALIWSLCVAEWQLALILLGFGFGNFLRMGALFSRKPGSRWAAIGLYGLMLWYVAYRIHQHNFVTPVSGAAFLLLDALVFWLGPVAVLHLICFDFAKQMRKSSDEKG